ncbi:MAG: hypothetical protein GX759_03500, partial [Thermoanaerobacterales bacterium]|nr:hypothetical protein [Thermoanaerobacterales bacterium]
MFENPFKSIYPIIDTTETIKPKGKISKIVGLTIESLGPPVKLGEICTVKSSKSDNQILAEVVGFRENTVILMPLGDTDEIGPGFGISQADGRGALARQEDLH